jgi:replicative DNA helicase
MDTLFPMSEPATILPLQPPILTSLPHNIEAEQALLGTLLYDNLSYEQVSDFLQPDHFSEEVHRQIFQAICTLIERGQVADPVTLKDYFASLGSLETIGGTKYLAQLATSVVSLMSTRDYGQVIYDLHLRRQLIHLGHDLAAKSHKIDLESKAAHFIEEAEQKLFDLATVGTAERGFVDFNDALKQSITMAHNAFKRDSNIVGVTTGLADVDQMLGGLHPSDLLILAGRPSMGKTALATNIAFNAAKATLRKRKEGATVAFFSLEMSAEQLAGRILSSESGVVSDQIRRGDLQDKDFSKFNDVAKELASLPLFIDDTPALSISALRTRCRRLKRKHDLGLIVIDYLQLLSAAGGKRSENRVQELSEITRALKALAKELHVPVIALSQLSRLVEQRDDKRPQLSDLRESGSIEQDADVVMFVFRQSYYLERKEPEVGTEKHQEWQEQMDSLRHVAELIIAKQRHGPVGTRKLYFNNTLTKFSDLSKEDQIKLSLMSK